MNKIYTLLFLALFLCINSADAQVPSLRAYQKSAKKAMEDKDYYSAMRFYQLAIRKDSSRIYNHYNLGEAARLFKSFNISRDAYKEVVNSNSDAHPLTEYWLAKVFQQQAEYDSAMVYFEKFLSPALTTKGPNNDSASEENIEEYKTLAQKGIQDCIWAQEEKVGYSGSSYKIQPFGNGVNTAATEFAPIEHQENVYYSGLDYDKDNFCPQPYSDITRKYTSTYVDQGQPGVYNVAEKEEGRFIAHTTFNGVKSTRMYFTVCERINASEFNCELFFRNKNDDGLWGQAIKLPDHINKPGTTTTHPNIGFDDNTGKEYLFFVSNRSSAEGGANADLDIYCAIIEENGQVGLPERLNVNTDKDDITPFFNEKENTLYFSSEGYQGFGGFDIFKSKKSGSSYATPESMGYYLNSSYDDVYFSTDEKFENAYFASNRLGVVYEDEGLETCCHDIFKLEIIRVDLNVFTFNEEAEKLYGERKPITELDSCFVTLYDLSTGQEIERKFDADSNYFYFPLELDREYQVIGTRDGRWTDTLDYVSTKGIKETTSLTRYLDLRPDVELYAYTFDEETKEPLMDCNFKFYSEETGELIYETNRIDDNIFYRNRLLTLFGNKYKVVASKEGYTSDSVSISTEGFYLPTTLRDSLYLVPDLGPLGLTVYLYFDNDEPDSNTYKTYSTVTYEEAFDRYYVENRIEKFMYENSKKLSGEDAISAQSDTRSFFDNRVLTGMKQLRLLAKLLDEGVSKGHVYLIEIEGSASPRSPSRYNKNLTSRRVSSVRKYLQGYSSVLANAIAQNNIQFDLIPRGEDPSEGLNIPYAYGDPQSIYSIIASEQRNVKITRLKRLDKVDYPITLFFDINQPSSSVQSYQQSFDRLMSESRRSVYMAESEKGLSGKMKVEERELTRSFFENEVKGGMINLKVLAQFLERNLPRGKKYQINIETSGSFSSAQGTSIINYLKRYNGGILSSYINSGSIQFTTTPVTFETNPRNASPLSIEGLQERTAKITGVKEIN